MRAVAIMLAGALGAGAAFGAAAAALVSVPQRSRAFAVAQVDVGRGGVVRFVNEDGFMHQVFVASGGLSFESDEQAPGTSVDVRFPSAGTFEVRCHIHPKMVLRVDVR